MNWGRIKGKDLSHPGIYCGYEYQHTDPYREILRVDVRKEDHPRESVRRVYILETPGNNRS